MNKFKTLVEVSKYSWLVATFLMLLRWTQIWNYGFVHSNYRIEDNFIYIGVLGGWIFVFILYLTIIFFLGYYILRFIDKFAKEVVSEQ